MYQESLSNSGKVVGYQDMYLLGNKTVQFFQQANEFRSQDKVHPFLFDGYHCMFVYRFGSAILCNFNVVMW